MRFTDQGDTSSYEFDNEEDLCECFIADCVKRAIDEDDLVSMIVDVIMEYVDDYDECIEFLQCDGDMDEAIDDYISSDDFESPFSLVDCTRWYVRETIGYSYDDMLLDISWKVAEDNSDDEDFVYFEEAVKKIKGEAK